MQLPPVDLARNMPETILPIAGAERSDRKPRTSPNVLDRPLRLQVVDVKRRILWWRSVPTLDALLHSAHQDAVAEPLPTLPGVMDSHDRPATSRRTSRVKDLPFLQALSAGMHRRD